MISRETLRDRIEMVAGVVALAAMVGGFALSFGGTTRYEQTLLAWLGYSEYNDLAFLVGVAGLLLAVAIGHVRERRDE